MSGSGEEKRDRPPAGGNIEPTRREPVEEVRRSPPGELAPTRRESVEEFRRGLGGPVEPTRPEPVGDVRRTNAPAPAAATPAPASEPGGGSLTFRPVRRPPMAILEILDDGREQGETIRIRKDRCLLGRSEGDVVISHDVVMSARHAEITRQQEQGCWRWYLTDLHSSNGTYVCVARTPVRHRQEFLIGGRCYRFEAPAAPAETDSPETGGTRAWHSVAASALLPSLVELKYQGEGRRFLLDRAEHWIGRDSAQCSIVLADDPLVEPRHARLCRDDHGQWTLECPGPGNGTWLRVERVAVEGTLRFQLGEQRFVLTIL